MNAPASLALEPAAPAGRVTASARRWTWSAGIGAGALVLAAHPLTWLVRTWTDPTASSHGAWIAAVVVALCAWSGTSRRTAEPSRAARAAWLLLVATAAVRLAGQVLAINVVGALSLPLDVLAIAHLLGLPDRARPLAPAWIAALFALSLPLERVIQRLAGHGLQLASAAASERVLDIAFDRVRREGALLVVDGVDAFVDLPCSGARGITWLLALGCGAAAILRPTLRQALTGAVLALGGAFLANVARISATAAGLTRPELALGHDVSTGAAHEALGLAALALGSAPLVAGVLALGRTTRSRPRATGPTTHRHDQGLQGRRLAPLAALAFFAAAVAIIAAPDRPLDASRPVGEPWIPAAALGHPAVRLPLTAQETAYFTRHGGSAVKARYGAAESLLVRTTAPLRHLHSPDECLRGAGRRVTTDGLRRGVLPSAAYVAESPDRARSSVRVTYLSDGGCLATSPAEAAWRWLSGERATWTSIERSAPEGPRGDEALDALDEVIAQALDAPRTNVPTNPDPTPRRLR